MQSHLYFIKAQKAVWSIDHIHLSQISINLSDYRWRDQENRLTSNRIQTCDLNSMAKCSTLEPLPLPNELFPNTTKAQKFWPSRLLLFVVLSSGLHRWLHLWNPLHKHWMGSVSQYCLRTKQYWEEKSRPSRDSNPGLLCEKRKG